MRALVEQRSAAARSSIRATPSSTSPASRPSSSTRAIFGASGRGRAPAAPGDPRDSRRLSRSQGIPGLSREMVERLSQVRPATLGQASRIPGVTPAAVASWLAVGRRVTSVLDRLPRLLARQSDSLTTRGPARFQRRAAPPRGEAGHFLPMSSPTADRLLRAARPLEPQDQPDRARRPGRGRSIGCSRSRARRCRHFRRRRPRSHARSWTSVPAAALPRSR